MQMKIIAERAGNAPDAEAGPTTQTQPLLTHGKTRLVLREHAKMHRSASQCSWRPVHLSTHATTLVV
jgi:hypothetical protein